MKKQDEVKYAGFWIRFVAALLDIVIIGIPVSLFTGIFFGYDWWTIFFSYWGVYNDIAADILSYLIDGIVTVLFWVNWDGKTPGKKLMGIKIVTYPKYNALTYKIAIIRQISYLISWLVIGLGYIMIAFREDKKGLHDIIAKTCVIYDK